MRKAMSSLPENADGRSAETVAPEVAEQAAAGGWPKKQGLNFSDVNALVRAVRAGATWAEAKRSAGFGIADRALESYREEILRRAGVPLDQPVLPSEAASARAPAAREPDAEPAGAEVPAPTTTKKGGQKPARKGK